MLVIPVGRTNGCFDAPETDRPIKAIHPRRTILAGTVTAWLEVRAPARVDEVSAVFGSRWDKAEATIVASLPKYTGDGTSPSYEFVADVRPVSGAPAFRATLKEPTIAIDFWRPSIGDIVSVLVKSNGKVKFDKDDPRISAKAYEARRKQAFDAAANQTFAEARQQEVGSPAGGLPTNLTELMAAQFAQPGVQVFSTTGDPERTKAAIERLRAAGMGGLADQVAQATQGQAGQFGLADQFGLGDQFGSGDPVTPVRAADPAARLGQLENLRDRGLMTDDEYAAQRQRILDEI